MARINISDDKTYIAPIKAYYGEARETNNGTIADIKDHFLTSKCHKAPFPFGFTPTFHRYRLDDFKNKKGRNIFVCSMADLFGDWIPDEWIQKVFKACEAAPQHRYLFLTKNPSRYIELANKGILLNESKNNVSCWYGTTTEVPEKEYFYCSHLADEKYNTFVSIEPIQADFGDIEINTDLIILGSETGNRKDKVVPKREWIENIVEQCRHTNTPVFMKNSLSPIWGESLIQEFPW